MLSGFTVVQSTPRSTAIFQGILLSYPSFLFHVNVLYIITEKSLPPTVVSVFHQPWNTKRMVTQWKELALARGPEWGLQFHCSPLGGQGSTTQLSHLFNRFSTFSSITNLDRILKSRDITLLTKVCIVKAMVFPVVTYGSKDPYYMNSRSFMNF